MSYSQQSYDQEQFRLKNNKRLVSHYHNLYHDNKSIVLIKDIIKLTISLNSKQDNEYLLILKLVT